MEDWDLRRFGGLHLRVNFDMRSYWRDKDIRGVFTGFYPVKLYEDIRFSYMVEAIKRGFNEQVTSGMVFKAMPPLPEKVAMVSKPGFGNKSFDVTWFSTFVDSDSYRVPCRVRVQIYESGLISYRSPDQVGVLILYALLNSRYCWDSNSMVFSGIPELFLPDGNSEFRKNIQRIRSNDV